MVLRKIVVFLGIFVVVTNCERISLKERAVALSECETDEQFFRNKVWPVLNQKQCLGCHIQNGLAVHHTPPVTWYLTENLDANFVTMRNVALRNNSGESLLLAKPTSPKTGPGLNHDGSAVITKGDAFYNTLAQFVDRSKKPSNCAKVYDDPLLEEVQLETYSETLRKATLSLASRLPTPAEDSAVAGGSGSEALLTVLDNVMTETAFFDRIKVLFNDMILTDSIEYYSPIAIQEMGSDFYVNHRFWHTKFLTTQAADLSCRLGDPGADKCQNLLYITSTAVMRQPLELIAHVVRNNLSFSEILTANYLMVNPYSIRTFGATLLTPDPSFAYQDTDPDQPGPGFKDPNDFRPATATLKWGEPYNQAGILTNKRFLSRYPTTSTNVNRHRARKVLEYFLGLNVLELSQTIDASSVIDTNPTLTDTQCTVCHQVLDPIAGLFKDWSNGANGSDSCWVDATEESFWGPGINARSQFPQNTVYPPSPSGYPVAIPSGHLDNIIDAAEWRPWVIPSDPCRWFDTPTHSNTFPPHYPMRPLGFSEFEPMPGVLSYQQKRSGLFRFEDWPRSAIC